MALTPEDVLRKLAKLPENTSCLNCGKEDKIFGFKIIVVKFRTFVCGDCKAAHQSFSHRVKVRALCRGGGGRARLAFLAFPPPAPAPPSHTNANPNRARRR